MLALLIGSMILVSGLDLLLDMGWRRFGIFPGAVDALPGILFAPWLHGSFGHLFTNVSALLVLGWFCLWLQPGRFFLLTAVSILAAGGMAWLFGGRGTVHLGASGIVFGYFAFLAARGWYERTWTAILISLLVLFFYGGMVLGILPVQRGVSWQSHLGGFLAGIAVARFFKTASARGK